MVYAHHRENIGNLGAWEPLFSACRNIGCDGLSVSCSDCGHIDRVARLAKSLGEKLVAGESEDRVCVGAWAWKSGLWHDLGKFAPDWQSYLKGKVDPHGDEVAGRVDHSTAGAQFAVTRSPVAGHLLAYTIAGHHTGLLDGTSNGACQAARLTKRDIPEVAGVPEEVLQAEVPPLPGFLKRDAFSVSLFARMIFSCLVDADFLATEAFMSPSQSLRRNSVPKNALPQMLELIDARIDAFGKPEDNVNQQRRIVVENCRDAAEASPGFFSLTVPTGGGKTLSSLSFALRHAIKNGQQRVIYVAPFTSIIEQNADVIRGILSPLANEGFEPIIEHHSALSPDEESATSRLASENWDAPLVITTGVQFYESLFARKTSRVRKLHNIANAVVILDEAQSLPVDYLKPCLTALQELSDNYHTTVVLCTATQPAINHQADEFPIGIKNCREIVADTKSLFAALKRVDVENAGLLADSALTERLSAENQVLCIVNRRKHAREIFERLGWDKGNFHLSALMCPQHRSKVIREVRERLKARRTVRLVSTQLIEAGVDVDFPVVYRALAGLDSIAQAAGRCNRHGLLESKGKTFVFNPEDQEGEKYFRETAQVASQLLDLHEDLLSEEAIRHYFDLYYYRQKHRWDAEHICDDFRLDGANTLFPFVFQFASAAEKFRLIGEWQVPLIIPYDDRARSLIAELRNKSIPLHRALLRGLQRYTVQIPPRLRDENIRSIEILRDGDFHALVSKDLHYSENFGLSFEETYSSRQNLVC